MTDTGQVPGEGLPENAGTVEQPGVPGHGAYTYLAESPAEDEDLLLPGAQSAWGNEVAPPAPEPVVETVHEPDPHETGGRDSGSVDLSGVRLPNPAPMAGRRPLHLGPPLPDTSASPVRSLADRGPAGAPVRQPGPEYVDAARARETPAQGVPVPSQPGAVPQAAAQAMPQGAVPWGAPAQAAPETVQAPASVPAPAPAPVAEQAVADATAPTAETVAPATLPEPEPVGAAQATLARLTIEATAAAQEPVAYEAEAPRAAIPEPAPAEPAPAQAEQVAAPVAEQVVEPVQEAVPASAETPEAAEQATEEPAVLAEAPQPEGTPAPEPVQEAAAEPAQQPTAPEPTAPAEAQPEAQAAEAQALEAQTPELAPTEPTPAAQPEPELQQPAPAADPAQRLQQPTPAAQPEPELQQPTPLAEPEAEFQQPTAAAQPEAEFQQPIPLAEPVPEPQQAAPVAEPPQPTPEPAAADGEIAPQGPSAPVDETRTGGAGGNETPEGEAEAAAPPHPLPPIPEALAGPQAIPQDLQAPREPEAPQQLHAPQEPDAPQQLLAPLEADAPQQLPAPEAVPALVAQEPAPAQIHPGTLPLNPTPTPLGEFVPVEGAPVPTTPHLAPTPPHPLQVPAQRDTAPEPEQPVTDLVQQADDLQTRAAEQEDAQEAQGAQPLEAPHAQEVQETEASAEARQSAGPAAPAYDDAEREAVLKVMRERRDIRNGFRSDPIPHEVLLRVLEAAHTAPSVGHSQPWDFVVIRSADTRRTMHELATRQREAYAKSLPKGRAKQFKELKIEAILDTPVNIVVTADPTRGGRHTLGRHTQPQMAPYSAALAVENLWLAARAEGLGVGWVSFFDEREMVRSLGLPEHLEVIAYLCVGYVDEFPAEPELMQAGWSKRRPLSWVVHEETYGRRALPGEEPHDLLAETVAQIRPLDAKALGEAWERQKRMTKPAGALGMLEIISAQLSGLSRQCPPPIPEPAAVAIFAGDHGVHAQGVTPWPQEVTAQMVANFLGGGAVCNAFANQVGAEVCVIDVGVAGDLPATPGLLPRKVRAGTSDMTTGPAMTREEAKQAIEVGIETARDLVAAGNKALLTGEMGIANTTASAALISVYTDTDPAEVTGRGTGINDETLARKTEVVRRAIEVHQPDPADPIGVLAAIGGFEHAAIVGLLLGGASLRTPVILDGVSAGAAALVARAIAPEVLAACIAGHRSAEPGHVAALNKLGLRPLVDLDLRLGEGTGALLALPLVQSTARAMHEVATFDSAGVTEK
ncbi:nicotinate-nucleotide--dimethylbenzimidazole phosphoribosyltransferase [Streptomyces sp. NPDC005017]|uniref:nicotinate-nucleotide--dimethylbenzimidazole phosphoribosyltransferase n=1 Tax=Streptomyces sp. NPDC005017 TaxID=3364706 RepID=UPI003696EAEA